MQPKRSFAGLEFAWGIAIGMCATSMLCWWVVTDHCNQINAMIDRAQAERAELRRLANERDDLREQVREQFIQQIKAKTNPKSMD